jgi:hypothetical protein
MQPGPNWVKGKPLMEQDIKTHFNYMIEQAQAGVVIAAAPDASGQEGWYILRGPKATVDKILAGDPGMKNGVLTPVVVSWSLINMQAAK